MYFLEQIQTQFKLTLSLWASWPDAAINEVREQEAAKSEEIQWPKWPDDVIAHARETNSRNDRALAAEVARNLTNNSEGDNWNDAMSDAWESQDHGQETPNDWTENVAESLEWEENNEKLLSDLSEKPPFNTLSPEERQVAFDKIMEEWFDVPEWMTREEAFEDAFNNALEKEVVEYDERIDSILEDEAIELSEEQRQALSEHLEGIEDPTIEDIHAFLQENDMEGFSVSDNPNTIADESSLPVPRTNLRSSWSEYSSLPSNWGSWSWENSYTWEAFEGDAWLDSEIYNIQRLKQTLPADRLRHAEQLEQQLVDWMPETWNKENWLWALYRNASNNERFSANQPVLLHNLSTATALVMINWSVTICEATHGKWVGNANGMHGTPIGSFEMYGMTNGKYQARMWVKWLEPMKQNINNDTTDNAADMDPATMWNANSDNRLIRVHESRWSQTQWCTGLPTGVAKLLADATRTSGTGIMERFVSKPVA